MSFVFEKNLNNCINAHVNLQSDEDGNRMELHGCYKAASLTLVLLEFEVSSLKVSLWFKQRGFLQPSSPTLFALLIKLPSADYVLSLFRLVIFFTILLLCLLSCYQKFILWCSGNHCLQREFFNTSLFKTH